MLDPVVRLRKSIINDELSIVKMILRRYPDLLYSVDPKNGWTLLHYASYYGRYLICVHLIQLRCDKDEIMTTFEKNTAVHLALMKGDEQTIHLLLQHFPLCTNMRGQYGYTPVHFCCKYNYYQVLTLLLSCGAKLDIPDDESGDYPMHVALKYGNLEVANILIKNGQNDEVRNKMQMRPSDVAYSMDVARQYQQLLRDEHTMDMMRKDESSSTLDTIFTSSTKNTNLKMRSNPSSININTGTNTATPNNKNSSRGSGINIVRAPRNKKELEILTNTTPVIIPPSSVLSPTLPSHVPNTLPISIPPSMPSTVPQENNMKSKEVSPDLVPPDILNKSFEREEGTDAKTVENHEDRVSVLNEENSGPRHTEPTTYSHGEYDSFDGTPEVLKDDLRSSLNSGSPYTLENESREYTHETENEPHRTIYHIDTSLDSNYLPTPTKADSGSSMLGSPMKSAHTTKMNKRASVLLSVPISKVHEHHGSL